MRAYPRILQTKKDYEYVLKFFPREQWEKDFIALLDTQYAWFFERYLEDGEEVEESATSKIVVDEEQNKRLLYVWKRNEHCKLLDIGYTEDEVLNILNGEQ